MRLLADFHPNFTTSKLPKSEDKDNLKGLKNEQGDSYFELGAKRRVTVRNWKNAQLIDIREYYTDKSGSEAPGRKGISLSAAQWNTLKECMHDIDQLLVSD
ncbi:hypothetical protein IWQ61_005124 [Dispira simplex]|nr:hypothetical protein IWQ61_005124 [Dispira simplex]